MRAADPDRLPGGQRRREPAVSGRRLPRPVRRGPDLLLQLDHAALPARAADQRGDGELHRRRRVPAGALRRDLHGGGHQLHGARRPQPGEGRHRPDDRRRDARRRRARTPRSAPSRTTAPPTTRECLRADPRVRRPAAAASTACSHRVRPPSVRPRARRPISTTSCRTTTGCRTTCATCSACLLDGGALDEFQPDLAREMICGHARIEGWPVGVIANQRGMIKGRPGERPRFGGIVYTESAEKVAYFIETASRERLPLLFVQDVSGFMVGPEAEHAGIIRAGARFVEAMATARGAQDRADGEPRVGRGLLRHGGAGLRSRLHLLLAHRAHGRDGGRVGGDGGARARARAGPAGEARAVAPRCSASMESMRADYEHQLDARYAARAGTWMRS